MKFSIIVPVYNVEKYLNRCLDSILNQTYTDFEIIIVNDGTQDNSQKIIDKYVAENPSKVKGFIKENGGLSDARNFGVNNATGEYIVFVDSDDYIDKSLLENIKNEISKSDSLDIIGYNWYDVNEFDEIIGISKKPEFHCVSGEKAIIELVNGQYYFEPAWGYAYKLKFWKDNHFEFMKGIYHEDYALIPLVIIKARSVSMLNFNGYYYIKTPNSITRNRTLDKEKKANNDYLVGYDFLYDSVINMQIEDKIAKKSILEYISKCIIYRLQITKKKKKNEFRDEIIKRGIINNISEGTLKKRIKKYLLRKRLKI